MPPSRSGHDLIQKVTRSLGLKPLKETNVSARVA
jgi:hypothetical protein